MDNIDIIEKKKIKYGFDYDKALQDKTKIFNEIEYPYIKYIYSSRKIIRNFRRLKRVKFTTISKTVNVPFVKLHENEKKFKGNYTILVNNINDYEKIDMLSDYFNEECRVKCKFFGSVGTIYDYYHNYFEKIINYMRKDNLKIKVKNIRETIWKYGRGDKHGECSTFRPKTMKFFIELFSARKILDISSGWGDRLIGAMASDVDCYHGFDPNPCLQTGYNNMIIFFKDYIVNKNAEFNVKQLPFEESQLKNDFYDLVMSSPPYFNIEIYDTTVSSSSQSVKLGENERQWYEKYLRVWINICLNALKTGGILALNINQFKHHHYVNWMMEDMRKNTKWKYLGLIGYANSDKIERNIIDVQPVFIWTKL